MDNNNFNIEGLDELQDNLKKLAEKGVKQLNLNLDRINNPEGAAKSAAVPESCPYCGAKLPRDKEIAVIKCDYCGAEFDNSTQKTIADSIFDFVEKQQEISRRDKAEAFERAKAKAEWKLKKKKKGGFIRFLLLLIVCFAILYYYFVIMGGQVPF